MPTPEHDHLTVYLQHLEARARARRGKPGAGDQAQRPARLPAEIVAICAGDPRRCLDLILRALEKAAVPETVVAIGDELLQNLLNESSAVICDDVSHQLRTNMRFRQAFSFGNFASVDPAVISEWVGIFQDLGTTKDAERKSLRSGSRAVAKKSDG